MLDTTQHTSRLGAALAFLLLAVVSVLGFATTAAAADEIYVDPSGDDSAAGTSSAPVASIARAVQLADDGTTIVVNAGRYHESVQVYRKQVDIVAVGDVVLDGATTVTGFAADSSGQRWVAPWATSFDRTPDSSAASSKPEAGWPEQFFLDGAALEQVGALSDLVSGSFFHDPDMEQVWIADDPAGRTVAGSVLQWGIYLNEADGSSVTGVTVERYATQASQMAAVRAYADDLVLTDVTVRNNARIGLSVIGDRVLVDRATALDNGHLGIHAHQSSELGIHAALVMRNNRAGFDAYHSAGGIKVTTSSALTVSSSVVSQNAGPGIWTDLDVVDSAVVSNTVHDNDRSGIEIELSSGVTVANNDVRGNDEAGIWVLESTNVDVWHNRAYDNVRDVWIEEGPRRDVDGVRVVNNLLGGADRPDGAGAILNVDDWTEERAASQMSLTVDSNRYWIVPSSITSAVSRWANWPSPLSISTTLSAHQSSTGQGADSELVESTGDPFTDIAAAPAGWMMPAHVASALGVDADAFPAGPLVDVVEPPTEPPTTEPPTTEPPTAEPPTEPPTTEPPVVPVGSGWLINLDGGGDLQLAQRVGPQHRVTDVAS